MYKLYKSKLFISLFIMLSIILMFNVRVSAQLELEAGSAILMEASTGKILYEKNSDIPMPPASITKLMTLLLAFEAIEEGKAEWDDLVPVSEAAWKIEGSRMFLEVGKEAKYSDIVTGISVVSANDGCVALAEYLCGSEDAFVQVMNRRAKELGLSKTQFKNSSGLPAKGHHMSARDIAVLAQYLIKKYPKILEIESQKEFTFNKIKQYNRNPLLGVFPGADGLKTGWTEEAGYCLVGTARQNGMRMISVVLNIKNEESRLTASRELLNYGFNNFQIMEVIKAGEIVDSINIDKGKKLEVPVKVDSDISIVAPIARKNDLKIVPLKAADSLEAPVSTGTVIGRLEVRLDGQSLATADISTAEDVSRAGFFELLLRSLWKFIRSLFK
jgi:D-alanyl-D-alanine carboxypeptidase (penicillin-binding protein 5/6)